MKKLLIGLLIVLFIGSVTLNFVYYFKLKNSTNQNGQVVNTNTTGSVGKVISVGENEIVFNDGQRDAVVKINADTEYFKNYMDPIEARFVKGILQDVLKDSQIGIAYTPESKGDNLVAMRVDILFNNIIPGKIESISSDEIVIRGENDGKEYTISLTPQTKYYEQDNIVVTSDQSQFQEPPKPEEISIDTLQKNQKVIVFLNEPFSVTPYVANKVLYTPNN